MTASTIQIMSYYCSGDPDINDFVQEAILKNLAYLEPVSVKSTVFTGELDDALLAAEAEVVVSEGKHLVIVVTSDAFHANRDGMNHSFRSLGNDGNFVLVILTDTPATNISAYLNWATSSSPFADSMDVLNLGQIDASNAYKLAVWARATFAEPEL